MGTRRSGDALAGRYSQAWQGVSPEMNQMSCLLEVCWGVIRRILNIVQVKE